MQQALLWLHRNSQRPLFVSVSLLLLLFVSASPFTLTADHTMLLAQVVAIAAATFISEDLTTIQVGLLIAQGRLDAFIGMLACFIGILLGDLLLFFAGRAFGELALQRAPLKWFLSHAAIARSQAWLAQRGLLVIALSRFIPGTRLPTYFVAGMLQTNVARFVSYFSLACAIWTPLLIGGTVWLGQHTLDDVSQTGRFALLGLSLYAGLKCAQSLVTWHGRRAWVARWRRLTRWEFWPPYVFYPPLLIALLRLAWQYRSLTIFTAANPAMPASGFVGESKAAILAGLGEANGCVARYVLLAGTDNTATRLQRAHQFMHGQNLSYPVVLKPDVGQRGVGVQIVRSAQQLDAYLQANSTDVMLQEHIAGEEFGVFYVRHPDEAQGQLFSLTHKTFPFVMGDGVQTLEALIRNDARAVCMAEFYCAQQQGRLTDILAAGEHLQLVELGSHCRGAIFLDGADYITPALTAEIDRISQGFAGFYFGRYDLRAASIAGLMDGRNFKILELNGVTSEATHIYDPRHSVFYAYRTLFQQWRLAFDIGACNRAKGARVTSLRALVKLILF